MTRFKIAFIGLGVMGAPMARNLLAAGHDVVAVNRSREKVEAFIAAGGRGAQTVADAARDADIILSMLPAGPEVTSALLGGDGAIAAATPGALVIDCSTIDTATTRLLAQTAELRGVDFVDAPVSGGEVAAIEGTLSVMVGGSVEAFDRATRVLSAVGTTVQHVGPVGSGQTVKAANQMIVAGNIQILSEALVFLEASHVDVEAAIKVLAGGLAGSTVINRKATNMLSRSYAPGFRIDLHHKDLGIAMDAVREVGVAAPMTALVSALVASLRAQGGGSLDHSALFAQVEQLSGRPSLQSDLS